MRWFRLALIIGWAASTLPPAASGWARGQLQAGPTQLELASSVRATRLTLRNTGSTPLMAQVRIYAWSQEHGEDRLHDTDQLVASPPIVELAAGEEHLVRVVRVGPAATGSDQAYRAVVDELPGDQSAEVSQVALRMRYVIPIHDRAAGAAQPASSAGSTLHRRGFTAPIRAVVPRNWAPAACCGTTVRNCH